MGQYYEVQRQVGTLLYIITSRNSIEYLVKVKVGLSLLYIKYRDEGIWSSGGTDME
jgi:hypothetical protein